MAKSSTPRRPDAKPLAPALPSADAKATASLGNSAKVVAWGIVFWGGVELAGVVFERTAGMTLLVQAALAEWGASRMGIAWTAEKAAGPRERKLRNVPRRVVAGAALGVGAAAAAVLGSVAVHAASFFPGVPSAEALAVWLAVSALTAVRDELLLRGVVLRSTRGLLPPWGSVLSAGAVAAAASFGGGTASGALVAAEALRGIALGGVWLCDKGAWAAVAANAAWMWCFGAVNVRFMEEPQTSASTLAVLALAAAAALLVSVPRERKAAARVSPVSTD